MILLKQFTAAQITAKDDALLYEWLSQRAACVFFGCEVTSLGSNQMRITAGRGIILGRTFEIQQEDFTAQLADPGQSWKGRVYVEIDLSNTPQPIAIKTVAAASLPDLVQEDINKEGNIYQFALVEYDASDIEASNVNPVFSAVSEYYPAAEKLAAPVKLGDADFDGSQDVTLAAMGAMPESAFLVSGYSTEGLTTHPNVTIVDGGYVKIGCLVVVNIRLLISDQIPGASDILFGFPPPIENNGNNISSVSCYSTTGATINASLFGVGDVRIFQTITKSSTLFLSTVYITGEGITYGN